MPTSILRPADLAALASLRAPCSSISMAQRPAPTLTGIKPCTSVRRSVEPRSTRVDIRLQAHAAFAPPVAATASDFLELLTMNPRFHAATTERIDGRLPRRALRPFLRALVDDAGTSALVVLVTSSAVEMLSTRGQLGYVLRPVFLLSLATAALLAAGFVGFLRRFRSLHAVALVAATVGLQLFLIVIWSLAVVAVLIQRAN